MREVFIVLVMIGLFGFAFFVAARVGSFLDTNYRGTESAKKEVRTIPVLFSPEKKPEEMAKQIRSLREEYEACAIIVFGAEDSDLMDYIDSEHGEYRYQIKR